MQCKYVCERMYYATHSTKNKFKSLKMKLFNFCLRINLSQGDASILKLCADYISLPPNFLVMTMKNWYATTLCASLLFTAAEAQEKKWLTMDDAILKVRTSLAPKNLKQLNWIPNTSKYYYISDKKMMMMTDAATGKIDSLDVLSKLNSNDAFKGNEALSDVPALTFINANQFRFETKNKQVAYFNISDSKLLLRNELNHSLENIDFASSNDYAAYTTANNLSLISMLKTQEVFGAGETFKPSGSLLNITNETNAGIVYGASNVHRNEFGISKGTFWSPSNASIAFYRMDESMVNDYPIIDWMSVPAKNKNIKYPMSGGKSHEVTVGIYNLAKHTTVYLKTGMPADQYLTNIAWSKDEQHLYIAVLNREQNHMWLNSYNALNGDFEKTLFEETDSKYVEPLNPMQFIPNKPNQFIWQSNRDGFNHLYLYDVSGKLIKQLTSGKFEVIKVLGFDAKADKIFYTANAESAINKDLYSVSLSSGKIVKLTNGNGTHTVKLSDDGKYFLDNFSSITVPNIITLCDANTGKVLQTILKSEDPTKDYKLGEMSIFTIKNENNDDLFCRLYKPVDFDSTKKYPVVVYLYNGPHVQVITNSWLGGAANLWFQYMAEHGYVVFSIDGRGSDMRGKAFEQAIHRQLGTVEMEDQLEGVEYLKSKSWIDASRIGIHGWSFGGFMTTSLMTRNPEVFKIGVAGGPVIDWTLYEIMYTERYMDTPTENPEGYAKNNLFNHIDKLKNKLMLIHGSDDNVVVWQHSLDYIKKCVDKGKQVDYFVYPGHQHNVLGKDRSHLYQKISDYFFQNL
jgi:dipeptidyl-peptidase 4